MTMETHLITLLSSGSGITLGLGAARVVAAVLILVLLLLLCAAAEHGEDGILGDRGLGGMQTQLISFLPIPI